MTLTSEIVLNEKRWAKEAIESLSLGKKPYDTIVRVAKYYKAEGYSKAELRKMVEQFMLRCSPNISLVKWDNTINAALSAAEKYPLICIDGVSVTDEEMKTIKSLTGILLQRLLFTLICLARLGNEISSRNNNWVNRPQNEIFKLANINITSKRQSLMVNDLWRAGMVEYSKLVDNTNLRVTAVHDGETIINVSDFRNIGNQYMQYINKGDGYFNCEICGLVLKQRTNNQKYCDECASDINRSLTRDRKMLRGLSEEFFERFDSDAAYAPV